MYVYILFSEKTDIFYVGFTTESVEIRLHRHLSGYYDNKFTSKTDDWKIFFTIKCVSAKQGANIEKHIKKMKSKIYVRNLKLYPEISEKLLEKYSSDA
jgi:putative endonuclease